MVASEEEVECWHVLIEDMSLLRYYFNSSVYNEKILCVPPRSEENKGIGDYQGYLIWEEVEK